MEYSVGFQAPSSEHFWPSLSESVFLPSHWQCLRGNCHQRLFKDGTMFPAIGIGNCSGFQVPIIVSQRPFQSHSIPFSQIQDDLFILALTLRFPHEKVATTQRSTLNQWRESRGCQRSLSCPAVSDAHVLLQLCQFLFEPPRDRNPVPPAQWLRLLPEMLVKAFHCATGDPRPRLSKSLLTTSFSSPHCADTSLFLLTPLSFCWCHLQHLQFIVYLANLTWQLSFCRLMKIISISIKPLYFPSNCHSTYIYSSCHHFQD